MSQKKLGQVLEKALNDLGDYNLSMRDCKYVAKQVVAAHKATQWQPIETAPRDGTGILLCSLLSETVWILELGYFSGEFNAFVQSQLRPGNTKFYIDEATHWMYLPEQPKINNLIPGVKMGTEIRESYHDNGRLKSRCVYKNSRRNGLRETWYENGQLEYRGVYKNSKPHGLHEEYYRNERIKTRHMYKNGILDGVSESWAEGGRLVNSTTYLDGGGAR